MNHKEYAQKTGALGEEFVRKLLESRGGIVSMSPDQYDSTKDMTVQFEEHIFNVEVKTQAPLIRDRGFSFSNSQFQKLNNVDYTIIIGLKLDPKWKNLPGERIGVGNVYQLFPNFVYEHWIDTSGISKFLVPIEQENMKLIHTLSEENLDILSAFTHTK